MYHDEKVIDGILCGRTTPDGPWRPYTLEAMAIALAAERSMSYGYKERAEQAERKLALIESVLAGKTLETMLLDDAIAQSGVWTGGTGK